MSDLFFEKKDKKRHGRRPRFRPSTTAIPSFHWRPCEHVTGQGIFHGQSSNLRWWSFHGHLSPVIFPSVESETWKTPACYLSKKSSNLRHWIPAAASGDKQNHETFVEDEILTELFETKNAAQLKPQMEHEASWSTEVTLGSVKKFDYSVEMFILTYLNAYCTTVVTGHVGESSGGIVCSNELW